MTPATLDTINSFLPVIASVVVAFLAGHFHVLLKNPTTPATPVTPVVPTAPTSGGYAPIGQGGILQMLNDVLPHASVGTPIAPVGQGGLLQLAGMTVQAIMAGTGTPAQKAAAASQITEATSALLSQKAGA